MADAAPRWLLVIPCVGVSGSCCNGAPAPLRVREVVLMVTCFLVSIFVSLFFKLYSGPAKGKKQGRKVREIVFKGSLF